MHIRNIGVNIASPCVSGQNSASGVQVLGDFGVGEADILASSVQNTEEARISAVAAAEVGNGMPVSVEINSQSIRAALS